MPILAILQSPHFYPGELGFTALSGVKEGFFGDETISKGMMNPISTVVSGSKPLQSQV